MWHSYLLFSTFSNFIKTIIKFLLFLSTCPEYLSLKASQPEPVVKFVQV